MKQKKWVIAKRLDNDIIEHLLRLRLEESVENKEQFLNPSLQHLQSPASFLGMDTAVKRIAQAIHNQEAVVIWGDFDADGVTSTAILWETLHQLGAQAMPYIPNRDAEGHGFSEAGIKQLIQNGVKLIITVDHGITALEEVQKLNQQGIDVIITDHHEPIRNPGFNLQSSTLEASTADESQNASQHSNNQTTQQSEAFQLPPAIAVIHPLLMTTPQPLAGCGVAYHVAYATWLEIKKLTDDLQNRQQFASDKVELAGIGTIADMVPLHGDNRVLAKFGLAALASSSRPGLQKLYQLAGLQDKKVFGAYDVGFGIAPRLNAPGRLADALESLRLLCSKDQRRAARLAQELDDLNKERQDLLQAVTSEAKAEVLKHADGVFVLAKPNWPAGVCGLAAGKIVEQMYRPAVVMEQMGDLSRGSARSVKGFDITAALAEISHLLESYGGHAMAAGFVAKTENLPQIEAQLSQLLWQQFKPEDLVPVVNIDAHIETKEINWNIFKALQQFEPNGIANPRPTFMLSNMHVTGYRQVGQEGKHLKLTLASQNQQTQSATTTTFEAIAFNLGYWAEQFASGANNIDVAFTLDENIWNGRRTLQLMVKDIRATQAE